MSDSFASLDSQLGHANRPDILPFSLADLTTRPLLLLLSRRVHQAPPSSSSSLRHPPSLAQARRRLQTVESIESETKPGAGRRVS